jgi:predicted amidohydrolase YtcJ
MEEPAWMMADGGLLITGTRVYTADAAAPWAEAILTSGNHLRWIGSEAEAREQANSTVEEIHVPGGLTVPGLNDSHIHMTHGAHALTILSLEGATTLSALQARLREYAAAHPNGEWIEGGGVFYEPFVGSDRPPRTALDEAVANRPVFLRGFDYHAAWCNTEALRRAGIERGAAIAKPNEVVVDPASGLATGMLKERGAFELVASLIDEPTAEERLHALGEAIGYVNRQGITSVQNMDGDLDRLEQYERLREREELSVRACHYMNVREHTPRDRLNVFADARHRYSSLWNRVGGIKLFIDGVVESKTALMFDPYADGTGDSGEPDMDPTVYREIVASADALELDVATHAIGDLGIHLALDAYEAARQSGRDDRDRRHRVEHIEVIHPLDIVRFARLGVLASMQPFHAAPSTDPRFGPWARLVGPVREPYGFAWRSLLESGARLSFGSDWPVVTPDVRVGLRTAMARTTAAGEPPGGWQPQQCVTLAQALDAYTRAAAFAERQEQVKGMLRAGLLADVTVFAQDLFALPSAVFPEVEVALTVVDGRAVHRAV